MQRMRRNYCRSVISLQEPLPHLLWISLNLHGILPIVRTPAYSVVFICVCWPPTRRVYNITSSSLLHRNYHLLFCCLLIVSQCRLALKDAVSVHIVKGISHHIHKSLISTEWKYFLRWYRATYQRTKMVEPQPLYKILPCHSLDDSPGHTVV